MSIPTSLTELSEPTDLLTVESKVFGDPKNGIGVSSKLCLTELLVQTAGESSKSKTSLEPGIGPAESFVVVDVLSGERPLAKIFVDFRLRTGSCAFRVRTLDQSDVDSTKTNMEANFSLDLDWSVNWSVGLVLGPDALGVCVPRVGKVGDQKYCSYP